MSNWNETTISEIIEEHGGSIKTGPFGTVLKAHEYTENGVPLISVREIGYGIFSLGQHTPRVPPQVTDRLPEYLLETGDIVFGRKGAVDRSAIVKPEQDGWFLGSDGIRLRLPSICHSLFVAYHFQAASTRSWLLQHATGTTMASLNQKIVGRVPITLPPLPEQRAIASVLGALDDKIELNRRMNKTLEDMAAAIFKAWFVDFEPVHAKANGAKSFPGMPPKVFATLPKSFIDSELGQIPEGWEVKPLPEIIEVNPKRVLQKGVVAPHFEMKNMPTKGHAPERWSERAFGSGMRFVNGDTLVARITPCLENGKTAFVDFLEDDQVAWGSTEYIVLHPKEPLPPVFAYCLARTEDFRTFAIQNMSGTSGRQRVPATSLVHFLIANPAKEIAQAFGCSADPLFAQIKSNMDEYRILAETRDTLLPKLLSGEVRVCEHTDMRKIRELAEETI